MNPQATQLVNPAHFSNLTKSFNGAQSCEQLQSLVSDAFESLAAVKSEINAELAKLQPLLELLHIPGANLTEIVTWIKNFVEGYLTAMLGPVTTYTAQLAQFELQLAALGLAVEQAASRFPSCSVSVPAL